ncbi:MAG: FG-GAP-like repeat-containing protein [Myxococcota bacterium]
MFTAPGVWDVVGEAIAAGDHDGDGVDDLIVGGYGVGDYNVGAMYLLYGGVRRSGTNGIATAADAVVTGNDVDEYLGIDVASGGDLDGDGTDEIFVGAYLLDRYGANSGAAFVLYGSAGRRSGEAEASSVADAVILGEEEGGYLGGAVALVRDMNGDGLDELLVGGTADERGSALLFLGDTTRLSGEYVASGADVVYTGVASGDGAGQAVYTLTDVTGDGYADAGVYGYGYDVGAAQTGALWVFGGGASLTVDAVATLHGDNDGDRFGAGACSPGDLDGDGASDLLVGAYEEDGGVDDAGAARLWYGPVSGTMSAATADVTFLGSPSTQGQLGRSLGAGDLTGDGFADIVLGAPGDNADPAGSNRSGSLYVWAGLGGE